MNMKASKAAAKTAQELEMFRLAFNAMQYGTTITDKEGYFLFFSKNFGEFMGVEANDQIGRFCQDVIPTSRMHIVGQTGVAEINDTQVVNGKECIVQRIPLKKNGNVVGVFSQVVFESKNSVLALVQRLNQMKKKLNMYTQQIASYHSTWYAIDDIVGSSEAMRTLKEIIMRAAQTSLPTLIHGETGTGKEMVAQAIHATSSRADKPFVRINCANISKELFEADLFGYEAGSFTGARSDGALGKFEIASSGTVFLDEIGEMPLEMQAKLLHVLESKTFYRVGANTPAHTNFRIICATNRKLEEHVSSGTFRKDLYYRINAISVFIPPLRKRREDIVPLTEAILNRFCHKHAVAPVSLSKQVQRVLYEYSWPGNARELLNCLEYALNFCSGNLIDINHLPTPIATFDQASRPSPSIHDKRDSNKLQFSKDEAEREAIIKALIACSGHKTNAAKMLGIHRSLLYKKMKFLEL
jgi:transcriptional regulator with PAS, ATPase and Fis domain